MTQVPHDDLELSHELQRHEPLAFYQALSRELAIGAPR
jgi:hypothetical protein